MREVMLRVDSREPRALREALEAVGVRYKDATLDTGDFHFMHEDRLLVSVERKTWSDLESAKMHGRFHDQMKRALSHACATNSAHFLLVEDSVVRSHDTLRAKDDSNKGIIANSTINRCILQRGVGVFRTKDLRDTASLLKWIRDKCERESVLHESVAGSTEYATRTAAHAIAPYRGGVIHAKKSANQDNPIACWINMLTVVKGMSEKAASCISEEYGDVAALIRESKRRSKKDSSRSLTAHAIDAVADVRVKGSQRRVGPAVAKRVVECLLGSATADAD
ncbi:hypothetical protein CYMTET_8671 [Cymbomonas tetramitiformis]|uniref:Crossover junction endonuclease MUS81 n=1 Tax=Cymbomonas tetramitiformis TaxID=36881 RepID=A0AAE0LG89_9CHLO|nr:hypothetical protein CYMTET_8671 [Cymbomonas tetramitiformis]|eukprot:gene2732-3506_t